MASTSIKDLKLGTQTVGRDAPKATAAAPTPASYFAFSAHGFFGAAMALLAAVYLGKFYVDVALLPAGMYAIAVAAGRAMDAITDPLMGYLSDHTRSRWGRRKPWILVGVLGNAVAFYMMLTPSPALGAGPLMNYFLLAYVMSFLFVTAVNVPRTALAAEFALEPRSRTTLFAFIAFFVGLGTMVGAVLPVLLDPTQANPRDTMARQAVIYVLGYIALNLWFLAKIKERKEFMGRGETPFVPGMRRALRNRPFRVMFISHVLTAVPIAIPATLMPFFVQYVLKAPPIWNAAFILAYLGSGVLCLPIWVKLSVRIGKLKVWLMAAFIGVSGGLSMFFVGPGDEWWLLALEAYVGLQSQAWLFLGGAMHADVIDYDELHTGKRREAQFSSLWSIIPKFALIPGAAIPLAILGAAGYVPNEAQSPSVVFTLRVLFALVPAFFNGIGLSLMWWYPLGEREHEQVRAGVERHREGLSAYDPITGQTLPPPGQREVPDEVSWFLDTFSARELRRYVRKGALPLPAVVAWTGVFAVATVVFSSAVLLKVLDLERDPGPAPTVFLLLMGLSLAGTVFHALRIQPARRFARQPVAREQVERHIGSLGASLQ